VALPSILLLAGLSFILYQPFADWFDRRIIDRSFGVEIIRLCGLTGCIGVFSCFRLLHGWWEFGDWMANPGICAVKTAPLPQPLGTACVSLVGAVIYLTINKIQIAWVPLSFGAWVDLIFRPGQSDAKERFCS
jgi:hypothetical protein